MANIDRTAEQTHLTKIEGATIIAWHRTLDLQAVCIADGVERLYLRGIEVKLDPRRHFHPTQQVINYCMCETRSQRSQYLAFLQGLTK